MDIDEEGIGDMLLDENTASSLARPGTSFAKPNTNATGGNINPVKIKNIKNLFFIKDR